MEIEKKTKNGAYWTDEETTCPRCNKRYMGQQFLVHEKESHKEIMLCISCGDEVTQAVVEKNKQLRIKEQEEYEAERKQSNIKNYRMSQAGKESIVQASKIVIVDATAYLATLGIEHNRYKGLFVAVTVESTDYFRAKIAVQSRIGSWLFENVNNATRAIRRLNKSVEITTMTGDEFKSFIEADKAQDNAFFQDVNNKLARIKSKKPQPKNSVMMLHVVKNGDSFEVGYYSKIQVNKQPDIFLTTSDEPAPIYDTIFYPIQEYSTLERAEEHVAQENLASLLRNNSLEDLKVFQNLLSNFENEEMKIMSKEYERNELERFKHENR